MAVEQALRLFWRHGYEGTSLSALTEATGVNVPSLYAAFGNKEALFRRALHSYLQKPASYLPRALSQPTARQAAEAMFRGAIDMVMNRRHPDGCLLVQGALASGPQSSSIRRELARRRAGAEAAVRRRMQLAVATGDLPAGVDPTTLARFLITVIWGMSVQASGGASRAQLEEIAHMAMQAWPAPKQGAVTDQTSSPRGRTPRSRARTPAAR